MRIQQSHDGSYFPSAVRDLQGKYKSVIDRNDRRKSLAASGYFVGSVIEAR
jgi:hypothetical protein